MANPSARPRRQIGPVMVLTEAGEHRLFFQFQGRRWALILGAMSIWLLTAAGVTWWRNGWGASLVGFAVFGLVLGLAAGAAATTMRGLEIDRQRGTVRYAENTLYRKILWEKPFSDFVSVSLYHPREQPGGRRARKRVFLEIVSRVGDYYPLGVRPTGAATERQAREMAARIGDLMGLPVVSSIGRH